MGDSWLSAAGADWRSALTNFASGTRDVSSAGVFSLPTAAVTDPRRRLIMASLATMCRDLGLDAVVEGIESEEQRALLQELGFRKGQGYLFGKPMSSEAFKASGT